MNSNYIEHTSNPDPQAQFDQACKYLLQIQDLQAKDSVNASDVIQDVLVQDMSAAIFGSNQIERAGEDLLETMRICHAIFRGENAETWDERSPEYQRRLKRLIKGKKGADPKHIIRSRNEVVQHALALQYLTDAIVNGNEPWTEELLRETHRILCKGVDHPKYGTPWREYAGIYRHQVPQPGTGEMGAEVNAGNTCFTTSKRVPDAMTSLVKRLNEDIERAEKNQELDPYYLASDYCAAFVWIHPFLDGNGRMCRLILNVILLKYAGIIVPIGEHDEERKEYIEVKRRYTDEAWGPGEFASFVLKKATLRLKTMKDRLTTHSTKA